MLRLPTQSINDLWDEISTYMHTSDDPDYYLFKYVFMVSQDIGNNNFFCAFLIDTEDSNEEYSQSIFLVDMFGICLVGEYALDIQYQWLDSFIDGEIIISNYDKYGDYVDYVESIFIDSEESVPVSLNRFKDIDSYYNYINYMNTLCDKFCLVNKLGVISKEYKRTTELIERCYGNKSEELIKLNELYLQVKDEVKDLKHNYPKETLGLIR